MRVNIGELVSRGTKKSSTDFGWKVRGNKPGFEEIDEVLRVTSNETLPSRNEIRPGDFEEILE